LKELESLAEEIRAHRGCGFEPCETCTNPVPGKGAAAAEILVIGEAPGKNEDLQGEPFVGAAGKLLGELLESIGLSRQDVFITNVLKARPPGNRDPRADEVAHSWPWLKRQVELIHPTLIVLLGRHAMDRFLPDLKISTAHGQAKRYRGQAYYPVYHPAAALYNGGLRQTLFDDFAKIPALLEKVRKLPPEDVTIEPAQPDVAAKRKEPSPSTNQTPQAGAEAPQPKVPARQAAADPQTPLF